MGFFGRKRAPSVPHPRKEPRFDGPLTLERLEQIFQDCVDFTKRPVSLGEGGACTLTPVSYTHLDVYKRQLRGIDTGLLLFVIGLPI